jgi:hypothetical protein
MVIWFLHLLITQPSPSPSPAPAGVVTVDLADVDAVWVPPGHAGPIVAIHGAPGVRGL